MEPGLIWILAGLALLGAELVVPGVFLLWIGLAAIGTGLLTLLAPASFAGTVVLFLALLVASVAAGLRLRRRTTPGAALRINAPEAGLTGRHGTVLAEASGGAPLRVRVGDSDWAARLPRDVRVPPPLGARVRVEAVDGTVLIVRPDPPVAPPPR